MSSTLPALNYTTPEEFIDYYYEQLKQDLGVYDLQLSKVGFVGFFLNVLGYTHFDLKQYYDSLLVEAFVGTAQTEESQYLHASIYGYIPTFSAPAIATGTIEFDMVNWLSTRQSDVVRREVIIGYDNASGVYTPLNATFNIDGFDFSIDSIYKFVEIKEGTSYYYYTDIILSDGSKITLPSATAVISVPLYSTSQYNQKEVSFELKPYLFGSYETYYFGIDPGYYLAGLEVYVTEEGSIIEEEYDIKYTKYLEKGDDKSVFLRKVTSTSYVLEFGSGIRGRWISGASIRLIVKTTRGTAGNLIDKTSLKLPISGSVIAFDYIFTSSGQLESTGVSPEISQVPLVAFDYSESGLDPLSGEDLRDAIVNYIQTRDNMISRQDFYNIAEDYFNDFKFVFKKINVFDNTVYLCRSFRDRNQVILYTTDHTQQVLELGATAPGSGYVITAAANSTGTGILTTGGYGYYVVAIDEFGKSTPSEVVTATIDTGLGEDSVLIEFAAVPYAVRYRVYGRSIAFKDQYWEINEDGSLTYSYVDDGTAGVPCVSEPTGYELQNVVYRPTFTLNGVEFVSPYIYLGNTRMNYYDGYLMRDLSRLDFAEITPDVSILGTGFDIPTLYLNLEFQTSETSVVAISNGSPAVVTWTGHGLEYDTPVSFSTSGVLPTGITPGTTYYIMRDGYTENSFQISADPRSADPINTSSAGSGEHNCVSENVTFIRLKSYHTISNLVFNISIFGEELSISNRRMECYPITNNYFEYMYLNDDTFGILSGEIQIQITGGTSTSMIAYNYGDFTIGALTDTLLIKFNDNTTGYTNPFTTVTLTNGTVTAATLVADINTAIGSTVASVYTDDDGYSRIMITPPSGSTNPNVFIGESSTCLSALGLDADDDAPAVLNGTLTSSKFVNVTDKFYQLEDISDQLRLMRYNTNGDSYIINIPLIESEEFESDPLYYLDKIRNFIVSSNFSENRMITDNIQCRFLNSYVIESPFIEATFLQSGQIFSNADYNWLDPVIDTRDAPPSVLYPGSSYRVSTSPTGGSDFAGHADEIASWDGTSWSFYPPVEDDFVLDNDTNIYWRWDGSAWVSIPDITLPLNIRIACKVDKNYIQKNGIDIAAEKEELEVLIAEYLQKAFTGAEVVFYNSLITDFVHTERDYIKSVQVYVTDSSASPNEMDNGIEIKSDTLVLRGLKEKFDIVRHVFPIIYWDVDNINLSFYIE